MYEIFYLPSNSSEVYFKANDNYREIEIIVETSPHTITIDDNRILTDYIYDNCSSCRYFDSMLPIKFKVELEKYLLRNEEKVSFLEKKYKITQKSAEEDIQERIKRVIRCLPDNVWGLEFKRFYTKANKCPGYLRDNSDCRINKNLMPFAKEIPKLIWIHTVSLSKPNLVHRNSQVKTVRFGLFRQTSSNRWYKFIAPYAISNVYESGSICWGNTPQPKNLKEAQNTFFSSCFNEDLTPLIDKDYFLNDNEEDEDDIEEDEDEGPVRMMIRMY